MRRWEEREGFVFTSSEKKQSYHPSRGQSRPMSRGVMERGSFLKGAAG